jgi:hypothetical protein
MQKRTSLLAVVGLLAAGMLHAVNVHAQSCADVTDNECRTNFTCQDGTCRGTAVQNGTPCSHDTVSGGCMTGPSSCESGECMGTVPAPDGTECNYPQLEKCYSPGHCYSPLPGFPLSVCTLGMPKVCAAQPSDPCKLSFCNPQTGNCEVGDKCFTFSGCETCAAGVCQPANIGQPCANAEGDFNECTTDDRCRVGTLPGGLAVAARIFARNARVPYGLQALFTPQQASETRGLCEGVAGGTPAAMPTLTPTSTPPTTVATPTPTVGESTCAGDCNGDSAVTVDEITLMVNIALENPGFSTGDCAAGNPNSDEAITIDEITLAVNNLLGECAL